jgi:hypothetical protein
MSEKNSRTNSVDNNTIFSDTQSTRTDQNLLMIQDETFNNSTEENRPSVVEPPTSADTTFNSPRPTSMRENIILIPEKEKEIPKIIFVELPNGLKGRLKRSNSRIETDVNSVSFLNMPKLQKKTEPQEVQKPTEELVDELEDVPPTLEELESNKVAEIDENEQEKQPENNTQDNSENKEKLEEKPKTQTSQEEIPIETEKKIVKIEIKDAPPIKKEKSNDQIIYVNDRERTKKQWWFWPSNYIRLVYSF